MSGGRSWTVTPMEFNDVHELYIESGTFDYGYSSYDNGVLPTLLLDASVLTESGNGSKETPYVVAY